MGLLRLGRRFFPPEQPDKLAEAVRELIADPDALGRMSRNARRTAETQFDRSHIAAGISDLFCRLVSK